MHELSWVDHVRGVYSKVKKCMHGSTLHFYTNSSRTRV